MQKFTYTDNNFDAAGLNAAISSVCSGFCADNALLFDIETTGFLSKSGVCYLIGTGTFNAQSLTCTQIFADTPDDEPAILSEFIACIDEDTVIITYNGTTFDLPFIKERCRRSGIDCKALDNCVHIDIFTYIKRLNRLLNLKSLKQKSIETFCGIEREDTCSGADLINIYREYIIRHKLDERTEAHALLNTILMHNREDVLNLARISAVLLYNDVIDINATDRLKLHDIQTENERITCCFVTQTPYPQTLNLNVGGISICISGLSVTLVIPITQGELKRFYSDYRNYYYLPDEDRAIHKSVASYVDSSSRQKASKENCFTKIRGSFIPYFDETKYPLLKMHYNDSDEFICYDESLCRDEKFMRDYAHSIIRQILEH